MKKIPVWPTLATSANIICGFSAIAAASEGHYERGAWLLLVAMLFDAADGRLARMRRSATEFGGQLDSLADIVSFGAAPAFLAYRFVLSFDHIAAFTGKAAWTAGLIYVICAALRLARFNVENTTDATSHRAFKGLPSPGAAGLVATMVIFLGDLGTSLPTFVVPLVPVITIVAAVLMVTNLRYPHIVSQLDLGGRPFAFVGRLVILGLLVALALKVGLFILFAVYVASGPIGLTMDQVLERLASSDSDDSLF